MKKKETKLWIILIILITIIIGIIGIVIYNKKNNNIINVEKEKSNLEDNIWGYTSTNYYLANGEYSKVFKDYFTIILIDGKIKVCYYDKEDCEEGTYTIKDNLLTISEINTLDGTYTISFEEEKLLLIETYYDGNKSVLEFVKPQG